MCRCRVDPRGETNLHDLQISGLSYLLRLIVGCLVEFDSDCTFFQFDSIDKYESMSFSLSLSWLPRILEYLE